jgi:ABC-type transport system involved in cytochrome bd biosynthesis fused ATPase/permease subunit
VRRADTILVLQHGQIAEQGPFAELVARGGIFATLYQTQFGGEKAEGERASRHPAGHTTTLVSPTAQ